MSIAMGRFRNSRRAGRFMTQRFEPRLDILPPAQREFWPQLRPAATLSFVLYGGTAAALLLGHRASLDFDFFRAPDVAMRDRATAHPGYGFRMLAKQGSSAGRSFSCHHNALRYVDVLHDQLSRMFP